jgi:hypothetical protein
MVESNPPAIRTVPFASAVAVCNERALVIEPVGLNTPLGGDGDVAKAAAADLMFKWYPHPRKGTAHW